MKLLFLTHRIPYPPNKGDKISSFNMMKNFSQNHKIYLGTFIDDADDWKYRDKLSEYCEEVCVQPLTPIRSAWPLVTALFSVAPLSVAYYRNRKLQAWVRHILDRVRPDAILMFSGCTGQFVAGNDLHGARTVFDAEDVDSEKYRSYAEDKVWPFRSIFRREARLLRLYEQKMAETFDATVFVSPEEAQLFRELCPAVSEKVTYRTQGVDVAFFDPEIDLDSPYRPGERPLVFVGAMNYWPNVKAATWFAESMFPKIRAKIPAATFYIVGLSPTEAVRHLETIPGVRVTGSVADVRPYVKHSWAVCLPLTIARGIQNKALEAMAMGKRMIATPEAVAGIRQEPGFSPIIASGENELIRRSCAVLEADRYRDDAARQFIINHYSWEANLKSFEKILFNKTMS